jgi:hypothetical protein
VVEDAGSDDVAAVVSPTTAHVHGGGAPDLEDKRFQLNPIQWSIQRLSKAMQTRA